MRTVAVDPAGNILVAGLFTGTNSVLTSAGLEDMFLAKYDAAGTLLWTRRAGGIGYDEARGVATDPSGNIYVGGLFQNTAGFGTTNLTSSGESDAFLAKYDPNGTLLWARKAGSADFDEAHSIAVDAQGNVVLTGFIDANATFGTLTLTNTSGSDDVFVAKCNSAGTFLWVRKAGGSATNDVGNGIALDTNANVYVTGYFADTATFGSTTLTSSNASPDSFLAKYDPSGNFLWARRAGGSSDDAGNAVTVDVRGNVTVAGRFVAAANFGNTNLAGNGRDIFTARYDSSGNLLWARKAGGNNAIYGDAGLSIAAEGVTNVVVAGYCSGTANFGTTNVSGVAFNDVFCCKYDGSGNLLWVRAAGGFDLDIGYAVATDGGGNVCVAGFFGSATIGFGSITLTNGGGRDTFLAKLGLPLRPALGISASPSQVVLSWPVAASNFSLEAATNLPPAAVWVTVPSGSGTVGTNRVLTLPASGPRRFFRLHQQ